MTDLERLSPEQRRVVESWGKGLAVLAGAGSGKTTTLVAKCLELLRREHEAQFVAVSFTERSAGDLRAKLAERLAALPRPESSRRRDPLAGNWVMTIHGLCGAIIREFPREAGFDGEQDMLSESEAKLLWERAMESLWFDELEGNVREALDRLLRRESRDSVTGLLARARDLHSFGALDSLASSEDADARGLRFLAGYVLDRYERLKRRRGALDFSDLERGADLALEHPSVRRAFHGKFELVLVDEFQDTNPLQARIIRRFCREDGSNLCVVGDPKQSIYRFRDADVSVFEDFCSKLPERHALTWNFRSRPGIIEYTNTICKPAFRESKMAYDALVAKREANGDAAVLRLEIRDPSELAAWIHQEVAQGVALSDMALLLRKIRGNEKWLKALTAGGIPVAVGSGGLFWEDPRVRECVAFLKWWDNPGNSLSGAIFLRAPWVGVDDRLLDAWVKADPTLQKPFFASDHFLARRLAPLRGKLLRPGELLLALLANEAVEAELGAPLLGLWHRAEELSSRGLGFHGVVAEFQRCVDEGRRERDVPPPRNQGQLSVLTLHSSKGLEFPHVILADLGARPRGPDSPLLFWDRERGAYLATRDGDGDRERDHPIEAVWRQREREKNLAESKRLFYVALTRARERLVLACPELPPKKTSRASDEGVSPFASDDWRGWVDHFKEECSRASLSDAAERAEAVAPASRFAPVARAGSATPKLRRPRHSVTEWNLLSRCPRAYEWAYIRPRVVAEGIAEIGLFTGARAERASEREMAQKELGSRVHRCLERGDFDGLKALEIEAGTDRFAAEPVISWALSSDWMAPAAPERGREVWSELAFELPIAGEVLVGSMDRVVSDGARYLIIDFKVTEKPKSVDALLEAYRAQIELYAWALARLEPEAGRSRPIETLLVNISPRTIQAVPVGVGALEIAELAEHASEIAGGKAGAPTPGPLCRFCEFRPICPEGRAIELGALSE